VLVILPSVFDAVVFEANQFQLAYVPPDALILPDATNGSAPKVNPSESKLS
jgi:hypothetical protein